MLPGVTIEIQNGALGQTAQTADGVCGMVLQGAAPTGLTIGTSAQIFSLAQAEALGITSSYDSTNSVRVWRHIKEFYAEAGTGAELWIMIVSQALSQATIVDNTQNYAKKLLNDANGRIKLLGVCRSPAAGYTPTVTAQIDADVIAALATGQVLADAFAAAYKPVRIVLDGYAFTGTTSTLSDLKLQTKNRCAVLIGNTENRANTAVGLLLGRLGKDPVQRNPGRVKSGSLAGMTAAYLGTATLESLEASITAIHDKGYITLRRHIGKAGYYFTDAPTAAPATDDYNNLMNGRVIDKATVLAYSVYVDQILDEIEIDVATGKLAPQVVKYYQGLIETAITNAMGGEISGAAVRIDPAQNVLATGKLVVELRITPVGYARELVVQLGLNNPSN